MDNPKLYKISPFELSLTVVSMITGVGILTLPRDLATDLELADGWISILLSGVLVMILILLYVRLQRYFPGQTLLQFMANGKKSKYVASLLAILFIVYFLFIMAFELRILAVLTKMYVLDQTPLEVLVAVMLLMTTYAVSKGIQGIIHLCLLFLPFVVFVLIGLISFNIYKSDFSNLLPIMPTGIFPVISSIKVTLLSFLGIEVLFFFMANMKTECIRALPLNMGVAFVTLLYFMVTILSYGSFTVENTINIVFPTIELAKQIEFPGGFFERLESLIITVWIMTIFNTISISHLLLIQILKMHVLKHKSTVRLAIITIFFVFIIAFIPNSIAEAFTFGEWIAWMGIFLYIISLAFGYLCVWKRKKINKNRNEDIPS